LYCIHSSVGEISGYHGDEYEDVLWDVAPCSLVEIDRRFRGAYCLHHQGDSHNSNDPSEVSVSCMLNPGMEGIMTLNRKMIFAFSSTSDC
jgi:hypothetical protein